jgi:hypothetical protein
MRQINLRLISTEKPVHSKYENNLRRLGESYRTLKYCTELQDAEFRKVAAGE